MRTAAVIAFVVVHWLISVQGQIPDFSGTWVVVPTRSIWTNSSGQPINITVFGERFTAEQTPQALAIAIDNEAGFKWIYRLDGSPSPNTVPGAGGAQPTSSTAKWEGAALIIHTTGPVTRDGKSEAASTRRTIRFNDDGTLRVEAPWGPEGAMIASVYARQR